MSEGTRYVTVTADDRSGHLWVVTCICLGFSLGALLARFASKFRFSFKFGVDDYVILVAFFLLVIQCALTIASLVNGVGKSEKVIDIDRVEAMYRLFAASQAFLYACLYAIKCSMIFLVARLFDKVLHPVWIAFTCVGVVSVIVVSAGCQQFICNNSGPLARWGVLTALDVLTELAITAIPIFLIRPIQMNRAGKAKVLLSLNARLLTVIFSILNFAAIVRSISLDGASEFSHPTTATVIPALYLQLELTLSFVAASILPCFRLLFSSSETERVALSNGNTIGSWDQHKHEKRRALQANAPPVNPDEELDLGPRTTREALTSKDGTSRKSIRGGSIPKKEEEGGGARSTNSQDSWPPFPHPESAQASLHTKSSQTPFIISERPYLGV